MTKTIMRKTTTGMTVLLEMLGAHLQKMTVASHLIATTRVMAHLATVALSQEGMPTATSMARTTATAMAEAGMELVGAGPMARATAGTPSLKMVARLLSGAARAPQQLPLPRSTFLPTGSQPVSNLPSVAAGSQPVSARRELLGRR